MVATGCWSQRSLDEISQPRKTPYPVSTGGIAERFLGVLPHHKSFLLKCGEKSALTWVGSNIQQHSAARTCNNQQLQGLSCPQTEIKLRGLLQLQGSKWSVSSIFSKISASQQLKSLYEQNIKIDKAEWIYVGICRHIVWSPEMGISPIHCSIPTEKHQLCKLQFTWEPRTSPCICHRRLKVNSEKHWVLVAVCWVTTISETKTKQTQTTQGHKQVFSLVSLIKSKVKLSRAGTPCSFAALPSVLGQEALRMHTVWAGQRWSRTCWPCNQPGWPTLLATASPPKGKMFQHTRFYVYIHKREICCV